MSDFSLFKALAIPSDSTLYLQTVADSVFPLVMFEKQALSDRPNPSTTPSFPVGGQLDEC